MPLILRQLLGSEKFLYTAVLFMLPITVFTALGLMTVAEWRNDALWALGILMGGKTIQGVADKISVRPAALPAGQAAVTSVSMNVAPPAPPEPPPPIRPGE